MKLVYKLFDHVICISSFLERHFTGKNVIRIPPLLPENIEFTSNKPDIRKGVNLIYAGEAGRKDRLTTLISALPNIQKRISPKIKLHIVGMNWDELSKLLTESNLHPNSFLDYVICHGKLSRSNVLKIYSQSHFSILFRESKRYALAGFPTKAMESLASGCPIITNAVGDLSRLVKSGENSFVLDESQLQQKLPELLEQALSDNHYKFMSESAISTAASYFAPEAYAKNISTFTDAISSY